MGMISEFKEFAMRGNVIDLAVGVVIGAAFGKIVTALVEKIIMPPLGMLIGKVDFSDLAWTTALPLLDAPTTPVADPPAAPLVTITLQEAACTPFGIAAGTGADEKVLLTLTAANSNGVKLETSQCLVNVSASAPPP